MKRLDETNELAKVTDADTKEDLQCLTKLANENIANGDYRKAFDIFAVPLRAMIVQMKTEEAFLVYDLKLSMANALSVVDINMARKSMPMVFAKMGIQNPVALYDECLPDLIQASGSDSPRVQEGRIKYNLLKCLLSIDGSRPVTLENDFLAAVAEGNATVIVELLGKGADVNAVTREGRTALHLAVYQNRKDLVDLLLSKNIDVPRASKKGNTALHTAVANGNLDMANILMAHMMVPSLRFSRKSDLINAKTMADGTTALHVAAKSRSLPLVKLLLRCGAMYTSTNAMGQTPLDVSQSDEVTALLRNVGTLFMLAKNNVANLMPTMGKLAHKLEDWIVFNNAEDENRENLMFIIMSSAISSKTRAAIADQENELRDKFVSEAKSTATIEDLSSDLLSRKY